MNPANNTKRIIMIGVVPIVLLVVFTIGLFEIAPRYEITGSDLLANGDFKEGLSGWQAVDIEDAVEVFSGSAILRNRDSTQAVFIKQTVPVSSGIDVLKLNVSLMTNRILQGSKNWHLARVYMIGITEQGNAIWKTQRVVVKLSGNNSWSNYSGEIPIQEGVSAVVVGVQIAFSTGDILVRRLELYPVQELLGFQWARYILIGAWTVFIILSARMIVFSMQSLVSRGATIIMALTILAGTLISGSVKEVLAKFLPLSLLGEAGEFGLNPHEDLYGQLSQQVHFIEFLALALLLGMIWSSKDRIYLIMGLMLFAMLTESLQFFTISRQPSIEDWLLDVGGAGTGLIILEVIRFLTRRFSSVFSERNFGD
jgi:VanZ family protein